MSDQPSAAPVVAHTREEFKAAREPLSSRDVAVVMTMGALHDGHARLIRAARQRHDHVVVTIFLNPLQFGPKEDLSRYPRTFDADMEICRAAEVDVVFAPTPDVVYPDGDVNEYVGKFFIPFADYPRPIYAIPGNHDWLDGLVGFMRHFCDAAPPAHCATFS